MEEAGLPEHEERPRVTIEGRDAYGAAQAARQAWRTLLWQVPALALTAQAILTAVIVDPGTGQWGRLLAAAIAWLAVTMALQLFLRHGYLQDLTEAWLGEVERASGLPRVSDRTAFVGEPEVVALVAGDGTKVFERRPFSWFARRPSRPIWAWVLLVLSLADLGLVVDALSEIILNTSVLGSS